jgi:hypothetical protein
MKGRIEFRKQKKDIMLRIDDTIFSLDIVEKKFRCNLTKCFGNCCRYGDSGAPVTAEEAEILDDIWPMVKSYIRSEGVEAIEQYGTTMKDFENDLVTPLIDNKECAYTIIENGTYLCGIEKAWSEGKITFQKPVSCHLYPVRIKKFSDFTAVNYDEQPLCEAARQTGDYEGVHVYEFLREPLIRAIGEQMYEELCLEAAEILKNRTDI